MKPWTCAIVLQRAFHTLINPSQGGIVQGAPNPDEILQRFKGESPPYEPRAYEPLTRTPGDAQIVAETLENAEHNLEAAIRCLEGLRLSAASRRAAGTEQSADSHTSHAGAEASSSAAGGGGGGGEAAGGTVGDGGGGGGGGVRMAPERLSAWAGQLVQEMQGAADLAQAHARAGHLLQQFEGDVTTKVVAAAAAENAALQNHVQALARDNTILKRAVAVQNQRRQVSACLPSSAPLALVGSL